MPGPHRCLHRRRRCTGTNPGTSEDSDSSRKFVFSNELFFPPTIISAGKKGKLGSDDDDDDLEDLSDMSGSDEVEEANTGQLSLMNPSLRTQIY